MVNHADHKGKNLTEKRSPLVNYRENQLADEYHSFKKNFAVTRVPLEKKMLFYEIFVRYNLKRVPRSKDTV